MTRVNPDDGTSTPAPGPSAGAPRTQPSHEAPVPPGAPRVLVSGASVAGPALAYWLCRYGFRVTVVERAPALRAGGQAVDLRGPALDVAARTGVLGLLREHATGVRGMSVLDRDGNETQRTTDATATGGRLDRDDLEVLRDDLSRILVDAGGQDVEYLFDDSIARIEERPGHVRVGFAGGAERTFDIVVGADGVHSHTRSLVFGPEHHYLRRLGGCVGVWTAPNFLGLDRWQIAYETGEDDAWGALVTSVRKNTELRVHVGLNRLEGELPRAREDRKRLLAERYADAGWELPRLLSHMWEAPDFHCDIGAQIHLRSWSRGRVVLLGDAAYCGSPASGQGSSMALVGAYVLAGALRAAPGDPRAAFDAYERELRGWVTANQALAERHMDGAGVDDHFYSVVDGFTVRDH
ncbi:FAD-dependent monooxygenase [Streptomyces albus]|uniref:FAD-dependent monooxygenase n=1 Tax=Streptomyces albus TaxID=1888 RepID=UPI003455C964